MLDCRLSERGNAKPAEILGGPASFYFNSPTIYGVQFSSLLRAWENTRSNSPSQNCSETFVLEAAERETGTPSCVMRHAKGVHCVCVWTVFCRTMRVHLQYFWEVFDTGGRGGGSCWTFCKKKKCSRHQCRIKQQHLEQRVSFEHVHCRINI